MVKEDANIGLRTNRIEALSDGIFAIAMTILVLGFDNFLVPQKSLTEEALFKIFLGLWPDLLHYVESFVILGIFWIEHHRQFHFIRHTDLKSLFINIFVLMSIALIPFSTVVVGDYGHMRTASFIFEANLLFAGLMFYAHWLYATNRHRLVDSDLSARVINFYKKRNLIVPLISILAIVISFIHPRLGTILYFSVPFILILYRYKI
jgi:uncharacterized membrane protein